MALSDEKRLITDPHFHLWSPSTHMILKYPSFASHKADALGGTLDCLYNYPVYTIQDFMYESKKYRLDKCVYMECSPDDDNMEYHGLKEVKTIQGIADKYGFPNGIIGGAHLTSPNIEDVIKKLMECENFRGIRPVLCYNNKHKSRSYVEDGNILINSAFLNGLKILQKYGLIFECHTYPEQLKYVAVIANVYSKLKIVINHVGYPLIEDVHDLVIWLNNMKLLSKCQNVYVKLSGWCIFNKGFNKESMKYYIETMVNMFGIHRCMFASNFPVDKPFGSYDEYWDMYVQILIELGYNDSDIDKLIHSNAINVYNLNSSSPKASKL